jgi:hypothetical protein
MAAIRDAMNGIGGLKPLNDTENNVANLLKSRKDK